MSSKPESVMIQLLREMGAEIADIRKNMADIRSVTAAKNELAKLTHDIRSFRATVASDIQVTQKETSDEIAGLRQTVMEHQRTFLRYGIISELEARVRRVEQHLDLPGLDLR
jgi:tRNA U54 and U55 pseudouridine synthase Pus10